MPQQTLPFPEESAVLKDLRSPDEWCQIILAKTGTKFSVRTMRRKARALGQYYGNGNGMLLDEEQVKYILLAEAKECHSKSTSAENTIGSKGESRSYRVANTTDKAREKLQKLAQEQS